jgi:hypothetical protein
MKKVLILSVLAVTLCLVSAPAYAGGTACFDWSCNQSNGACTVNASCSTASPYIYKYSVDWGDGTYSGWSGDPTFSHSYASGTYSPLITVQIIFFSDSGSDTASCYAAPYPFPIGPQAPGQGRCQ